MTAADHANAVRETLNKAGVGVAYHSDFAAALAAVDALVAQAEAAEAELAAMHESRARDIVLYTQAAEADNTRLRAALRVLLEWAEKDRDGGYPEADRSEEWYTHRDFARAALATDRTEAPDLESRA